MPISLINRFREANDLDDLRSQLGEFAARLEDHLNSQVTIHFVTNKKKKRKKYKKGDVVFDLTGNGTPTIQQWSGQTLLPISVSASSITGFLDLIAHGQGSGTDNTKYLRSDGAGKWTLQPAEETEPYIATDVIPQYAPVTLDGHLADSTNSLHFGRVLGISLDATGIGFAGRAKVEGEITNNAWAWTPNTKLYLNGTTLSMVAPSTGFSQPLALAQNVNTIICRIGVPILL